MKNRVTYYIPAKSPMINSWVRTGTHCTAGCRNRTFVVTNPHRDFPGTLCKKHFALHAAQHTRVEIKDQSVIDVLRQGYAVIEKLRKAEGYAYVNFPNDVAVLKSKIAEVLDAINEVPLPVNLPFWLEGIKMMAEGYFDPKVSPFDIFTARRNYDEGERTDLEVAQ